MLGQYCFVLVLVSLPLVALDDEVVQSHLNPLQGLLGVDGLRLALEQQLALLDLGAEVTDCHPDVIARNYLPLKFAHAGLQLHFQPVHLGGEILPVLLGLIGLDQNGLHLLPPCVHLTHEVNELFFEQFMLLLPVTDLFLQCSE